MLCLEHYGLDATPKEQKKNIISDEKHKKNKFHGNSFLKFHTLRIPFFVLIIIILNEFQAGQDLFRQPRRDLIIYIFSFMKLQKSVGRPNPCKL